MKRIEKAKTFSAFHELSLNMNMWVAEYIHKWKKIGKCIEKKYLKKIINTGLDTVDIYTSGIAEVNRMARPEWEWSAKTSKSKEAMFYFDY